MPIKVISERLDHSTVTMTVDTYAHLTPAVDQKAADTFDLRIRA